MVVAKPVTPLNIKLSVVRRDAQASADDSLQMSLSEQQQQ